MGEGTIRAPLRDLEGFYNGFWYKHPKYPNMYLGPKEPIQGLL